MALSTRSKRSQRPGRQFIAPIMAVVVCVIVWVHPSVQSAPANDWITQVGRAEEAKSPVSAAPNTKWRYTRYGWQRPTDWYRSPSYVSRKTIDQVNPMLWAIDVLLAVTGVMIWASDEWQVAQLMGRERKTD